MRVDLFDFELPEERIALRPASPRDAARLLVVRPGDELEDRGVRDLPGHIGGRQLARQPFPTLDILAGRFGGVDQQNVVRG